MNQTNLVDKIMSQRAKRISKRFLFCTTVLTLAPAATAGTVFPFEIWNDSSYELNISFSDRQNCLEPSLMAAFIGATIRVPANGKWSTDIARRNGHGCDGENAVFLAELTSSAPDVDITDFVDQTRKFYVSGDGGMWAEPKRGGQPGIFKQGGAGSAFVWAVSDPLPMPPADKVADLLQTYAPLVYLAEGEEYNPASVDWAFPYLSRVERDGNYWLYTKQDLSGATDGDLAVFKGQGTDATAYGFFVRKAIAYDLVYFTYYPYNRGKHLDILGGSVFGNHVGDWENVVVRLDRDFTPAQVFLSQHDQGQRLDWDAVPKSGATHPIVYAAAGSHGYYPAPGHNQYHDDPPLIDETSAGTAWSLATNLERYNFNERQGVAETEWPQWMSTGYAVRYGNPSETSADAGPIYRWGNGETGCGGALHVYQKLAGACRLEDGPTGPIDKLERWDLSAHCRPDQRVSSLYQNQACD